MATDYDQPRTTETDSADPLDLQPTRKPGNDETIDADDSDLSELVLPGADLSDETLQVNLVPVQPDEFTCTHCLLVRHRSQLHQRADGATVCNDCAA